jgi:hypothetical protein
MYLYSKKTHRDHVIRCIFGTKNKGKLICNSPNDFISGKSDSEKVDQDYIFSSNDLNITHTKNDIWVSRTVIREYGQISDSVIN